VDDPLRRALGEMRDLAPTSSGARVLVAEDNEHILQLIERTLPRRMRDAADVTVDTASDGEEAWAIIQRGGIDLAILDVYMPGLDGLEVLGRVRDDAELATLPVVIISAAGQEVRSRAYAEGADFFMDKPIRLLEIVDTVRMLLRLPSS
jgi:CheY-like chemotaxis protein